LCYPAGSYWRYDLTILNVVSQKHSLYTDFETPLTKCWSYFRKHTINKI